LNDDKLCFSSIFVDFVFSFIEHQDLYKPSTLTTRRSQVPTIRVVHITQVAKRSTKSE
jgi:hypothetical protein